MFYTAKFWLRKRRESAPERDSIVPAPETKAIAIIVSGEAPQSRSIVFARRLSCSF